LVFSPGAIPIAYLKTGYPVVMWSDATFAVMENYYPEFTGLAYSTIHDCHAYEHKVMTNSDMLIFSSEWAARSAVSRYHAKPSHVHVIQYGANINSVFTTNEEIENIINSRSRAEMKLLFIGQNWERKGAAKAIEVVNNLNKNGLNASLTIIGCKPPDNFALPQCVNVLGFVDKSKPEGMKLIEDCFRNSHFFILPTIAECTPIVFSEANSFALPVLSNHTGGIPSVIQDNINGLLFDPEADAETWVKGISKIWNNPSNYVKLCQDSYNEYFNRLNWDSAIAKLLPLLQEVVVQHSQN
jgi:glycosyltransferase involved in cell wall biosynthesis